MSDSSVHISPTDFIVAFMSVYVALNYSAFLAWAGTLASPVSGLMTVTVYLLTIVGVIELLVIGILVIVVILAIITAILKAVSKAL